MYFKSRLPCFLNNLLVLYDNPTFRVLLDDIYPPKDSYLLEKCIK